MLVHVLKKLDKLPSAIGLPAPARGNNVLAVLRSHLITACYRVKVVLRRPTLTAREIIHTHIVGGPPKRKTSARRNMALWVAPLRSFWRKVPAVCSASRAQLKVLQVSTGYSGGGTGQDERASTYSWRKLLAGGALVVAGWNLFKSDRHTSFLTAQCKSETKKMAGEERPDLPNYSKEEISKRSTVEDEVWVTYRDGVYNVTEFLAMHPGGSDKLMLAAGSAVDPYWEIFAQHNSPVVADMIEEYRIGNIAPVDRTSLSDSAKEGPYANDPVRSPIFKVNTKEPFNAETPPVLLPQHFITPNNIFFVRNHLPVPVVAEESYRLEVTVSGKKTMVYSLEDLRSKFPQYCVTATVQCAGNRREELAQVKEVRGLSWTGGAIGNATWTGVRLRDLLTHAGLEQQEDEEGVVKHIHFEGLDQNPLTGQCYGASIPVEKALSTTGDCLLAHSMNGEPLPRDHGYPVRAVVPGTVGARNVKWVCRVVASPEEYGGQWQQRDYKGFSPSTDWYNVDFSTAPAIQELPVTSLICSPPPNTTINTLDNSTIRVEGVAWSGGGRGIVRVDVSADGGKTWMIADLKEGTGQRLNRAWAWTSWEIEVPLSPAMVEAGEMELCCKAVDRSYNVQPDTAAPIWNLRGCLSNAWHRTKVQLKT